MVFKTSGRLIPKLLITSGLGFNSFGSRPPLQTHTHTIKQNNCHAGGNNHQLLLMTALELNGQLESPRTVRESSQGAYSSTVSDCTECHCPFPLICTVNFNVKSLWSKTGSFDMHFKAGFVEFRVDIGFRVYLSTST